MTRSFAVVTQPSATYLIAIDAEGVWKRGVGVIDADCAQRCAMVRAVTVARSLFIEERLQPSSSLPQVRSCHRALCLPLIISGGGHHLFRCNI